MDAAAPLAAGCVWPNGATTGVVVFVVVVEYT
jgi:hypothetical protein